MIKVKLEADEIPKPQLSEYAAKSPSEIAAKVALTDNPADNVLIQAGSVIEAGGLIQMF